MCCSQCSSVLLCPGRSCIEQVFRAGSPAPTGAHGNRSYGQLRVSGRPGNRAAAGRGLPLLHEVGFPACPSSCRGAGAGADVPAVPGAGRQMQRRGAGDAAVSRWSAKRSETRRNGSVGPIHETPPRPSERVFSVHPSADNCQAVSFPGLELSHFNRLFSCHFFSSSVCQ